MSTSIWFQNLISYNMSDNNISSKIKEVFSIYQLSAKSIMKYRRIHNLIKILVSIRHLLSTIVSDYRVYLYIKVSKANRELTIYK